jgi:hypothetical protein
MHFNGRGLRHKTYQACSKKEFVKHWYTQVLTSVYSELEMNLQVNCCGVSETIRSLNHVATGDGLHKHIC